MPQPLVGIVMGSDSDWETMQAAARQLAQLDIPFESRVVSAHRTPDLLFEYAATAAGRGLKCIIAGAGGAAHLPGMLASKTSLPILGVPVSSRQLKGIDSLLSIVQMPAGIPVATFAIGEAGAINAALYAAAILALGDEALATKLTALRDAQTQRVLGLSLPDPLDPAGRHARRAGRRAAGAHVRAPGPRHGLPRRRARARPRSPAGQVADHQIVASYDDPGALDQLAEQCAAITTEFENVPAPALERLAARLPVSPSPASVAVAQERAAEKDFLAGAGFRTAPFARVSREADFTEALKAIGVPALLKTSRLGYDGKGQALVVVPGDAPEAFRQLGGVPCVLERKLDLELEISVVLARGRDGSVAAFPPAENVHRHGILHTSTVPARVPAGLGAEAMTLATEVAAALEYVGVLAVEMFVADGGRLYVNELAPRPHNSGHYTIDACTVDQFEQQVRTMTGLPLGRSRAAQRLLHGQRARRLMGAWHAPLGPRAGPARGEAASLRKGGAAGGPEDGASHLPRRHAR